jgi:Rhodopirellula transposase DDE domain
MCSQTWRGATRARKKRPGLTKELHETLKFATAGDPMSSKKWTRKSCRTVAEALGVSHTKARRLVRKEGYHLRINRKRLTRRSSPDREEQFGIIERLREEFQGAGHPIISVDAKKRELVGPFKNAGRAWSRESVDVSMYDYPSDADGVAIPYGVYDVSRGDGFVAVGTSHNTAAFAVFSIATWWALAGKRVYEGAKKLLILADGGSSNSAKAVMWKIGVQALATLLGVDITVAHYPTGASKWNPVEHRLFGPISSNWAGVPLRCYRTILGLIRNTPLGEGRVCHAVLDRHTWPTQKQLPPGILEACRSVARKLRVHHGKRLPRLNYAVSPNRDLQLPSMFLLPRSNDHLI